MCASQVLSTFVFCQSKILSGLCPLISVGGVIQLIRSKCVRFQDLCQVKEFYQKIFSVSDIILVCVHLYLQCKGCYPAYPEQVCALSGFLSSKHFTSSPQLSLCFHQRELFLSKNKLQLKSLLCLFICFQHQDLSPTLSYDYSVSNHILK